MGSLGDCCCGDVSCNFISMVARFLTRIMIGSFSPPLAASSHTISLANSPAPDTTIPHLPFHQTSFGHRLCIAQYRRDTGTSFFCWSSSSKGALSEFLATDAERYAASGCSPGHGNTKYRAPTTASTVPGTTNSTTHFAPWRPKGYIGSAVRKDET